MADRSAMLKLLQEIETEMRGLSLWETVAPPADAFDSQLPFCFDTMRFSQWLQWVFVARFRAIIAGGHRLPESCGVANMAEEALRELDVQTDALVVLLKAFDAQFPSAGQ